MSNDYERPEFTAEQVKGMAMQAAGAAVAICMQGHHGPLPTREITDAVNRLLAPYGIAPETGCDAT